MNVENLKAYLQQEPDGTLDAIAEKFDTTLFAVIQHLPNAKREFAFMLTPGMYRRLSSKRFAICFVISSAFTTDTLPATSLIDCSLREATTTTVSILFNDWSSFTLFFSFAA
nr:hypothetical protein [Vibrio mediterranei]